jgi:hypothetical protein
MTRRSISKATRVRVFLDAAGVCHLCGLRIDAPKAKWNVEHVKPLSMGGTDDRANLRPAHVECHAVKSADEAGPRAKADRAGAHRLGIRNPVKIQSAGFAQFKPQARASTPLSKPLPPRRSVT